MTSYMLKDQGNLDFSIRDLMTTFYYVREKMQKINKSKHALHHIQYYAQTIRFLDSLPQVFNWDP